MVDNHIQLVEALNKILPTHYEMTLHSGLDTPCISYMETNNYPLAETIGARSGYSRITYQVKVWGNELSIIQHYAVEIDRALQKLGYKRISSGELYDNNSTMIQKILTYECLAHEEYN